MLSVHQFDIVTPLVSFIVVFVVFISHSLFDSLLFMFVLVGYVVCGHFSSQSPSIGPSTRRRTAPRSSRQPRIRRQTVTEASPGNSSGGLQSTVAAGAPSSNEEDVGSDDEASVGTQNVVDEDSVPAEDTNDGILAANPGQPNANGFIIGQVTLENRQSFVKNDAGRGSIMEFRGLHPYDIVKLLWKDIMIHVVNCFNLRLTQEGLSLPRLTCGQLEAWHGCRIIMGLVRMPKFRGTSKTGLSAVEQVPSTCDVTFHSIDFKKSREIWYSKTMRLKTQPLIQLCPQTRFGRLGLS